MVDWTIWLWPFGLRVKRVWAGVLAAASIKYRQRGPSQSHAGMIVNATPDYRIKLK